MLDPDRWGLEIGISKPILLRCEQVELGLGKTILYASDLHLRSSNQARIEEEICQILETHKPDFLLLGGDLADHKDSLPTLAHIVETGAKWSAVGAVAGNHDSLIGKALVRQTVLESGGSWLPDQAIHSNELSILGHPQQAALGTKSVLCSHYPTSFSAARAQGIDLTLAGHLHGWQIVLWRKGEYLYPGAFLSRWNGTRFQREDSTLLVSRGMTDLCPIRWNCPREVILVET